MTSCSQLRISTLERFIIQHWHRVVEGLWESLGLAKMHSLSVTLTFLQYSAFLSALGNACMSLSRCKVAGIIPMPVALLAIKPQVASEPLFPQMAIAEAFSVQAH